MANNYTLPTMARLSCRPPSECMGVDMQEYATAQSMMADSCLKLGYAHTLGFYEVGDGGEAWYVISPRETENNTDILHCINYSAKLIVSGLITSKQVGCIADGSTDDAERIQKALDYKTPFVLINGDYFIGSTLYIYNDFDGSGSTIHIPSQNAFNAIERPEIHGLYYGNITVVDKSIFENVTLVSTTTDRKNMVPYYPVTQSPCLAFTDGSDFSVCRNVTAQYMQGHSIVVWGHDITGVRIEQCKCIDCGVGITVETRNDSTGITGSPNSWSVDNCYNDCNIGMSISSVYGASVSNTYSRSNGNSATQLNIQEVDKDSILVVEGCHFLHTMNDIDVGTSRALSIIGGTNGNNRIQMISCLIDYISSDNEFAILCNGGADNISFINCTLNGNLSCINTDCSISFINSIISYDKTNTTINMGTGQLTLLNNKIECGGYISVKNLSAISNIIEGQIIFGFQGADAHGVVFSNDLNMTGNFNYGASNPSNIVKLANKLTGNFTSIINNFTLLGNYVNESELPSNSPYNLAIVSSTHKIYACYGSNWYDANGNLVVR